MRAALRGIVISVFSAVLMTAAAQSPSPSIQQPFQRLTLQRTDILTPRSRLEALAKNAARFPTLRSVPLGLQLPASGVGINGLRYSIARSAPSLPASGPTGNTVAKSLPNNLVVCKTTPWQLARQFAGPLFIGSGTSINQSVIYPGALFRDTDIVRGQFTPVTPARRPGSITIDVFNLNGSVSTEVSNFNDRTAVLEAINRLRSQAASAETPANLDYAALNVSSSQELSLGLESSADVDIGPSLQLSGLNAPFNQVGLTGGFSVDAAVNLSNSFNFAVGVLDQTFYTISLGGQGPAATVQDDIGANVLAVTDVQYGRIAYIIVASASSSATASAVANQLVTLSNPFVSVSGDRQLSAAARAALAGGFVRVKILGGSSSTAVTVTDLATLRNYIQQIRPTVGGSNAVPIRYTLRYARDNATAFVQALANFNDRECARASQLKVKLKSITATKVEEVGGEELYGTVRVKTGPGITAVDGNTLWDVDADNAVDGSKDRPIQINRERTFNINPLDGELADVTLSLNLRDRIAAEEHPFTTKFGQDNGFVRYGPDQVTVKLQDIRDAPDAKLSKNFTLTEDGADSTLRLSFDFELVPVY